MTIENENSCGNISNETDKQNGNNVESETSDTLQEGTLTLKVMKKIEQVVESKGVKDFSIDVSRGSNVGDNFMGFIGKVIIKGKDEKNEDIQFNWIVKSAPQTDMYRKLMQVETFYAREVLMYEKIFPTFKLFQDERHVVDPFREYPKFVFSYLEYLNESFGMEDLKIVGYTMRNRQQTLDYHHAKMVMKTYAKFHAVSYAMRDQSPELFNELTADMKDVMFEGMNMKEAYHQQGLMMDVALKALDPVKDKALYEKFTIFRWNFIDIFIEAATTTTDYSVIGHGDSWVNNMLWKYDDEKNPERPSKVCLLDFQLARYASPACDLSYFIFTCTDKELRDKHYDDLIKLYYYTLCCQLTEMGSDPEKVIPFSALQDELRHFCVSGLYFTTLVLSIITKETDEIPNMKAENINEEELGEQFTKESKNQKVYYKRVRDVVVDYYEKGYFDVIDKYRDVTCGGR